MKRIINITLLELTKLLKKREFLLGLIMVLVMGAGMTYGAYAFPDSFGVHNVIDICFYLTKQQSPNYHGKNCERSPCQYVDRFMRRNFI